METIYWHLIEKNFCWDESIALYEEPEKDDYEKNNNMFDNLAFYDSVAKIAGRAIVTIEPLPEKKLPPTITEQPKLNDEETRRATKPSPVEVTVTTTATRKQNVATLPSPQQLDVTTLEETVATRKVITQTKLAPPKQLATIAELDGEKTKTNESDTATVPIVKSRMLRKKSPSLNDLRTSQDRLNATAIEPSSSSDIVKPRKKSLAERRMSKSLSLNLDNYRYELPIIRQSSVPKFYVETPPSDGLDRCVNDSSILRSPSCALTSPIKPTHWRFEYDLRSIVQMEMERVHNETRAPLQLQQQQQQQQGTTTTTIGSNLQRQNSKLANFREKLRPLKIRRYASTSNLQRTNLSNSSSTNSIK